VHAPPGCDVAVDKIPRQLYLNYWLCNPDGMTMRLGKMDADEYRVLLDTNLPRVITTARQHKLMSKRAEELMVKGDRRSAAETEFLKLIVSLIEAWENHIDLPPKATPVEVLHFLMEARGHTPKDLESSVGMDKSLLSNVLKGQREISKEMAKKLASFYRVSPAVFI
jgi:HTH-type transcriptional regulator / antitoxin HigA